MKETKEKSVISVRLDNDLLEKLQVIAELEASTLADEIRKAVDNFLKAKTQNKKKLSQMIEQANEKRESRLKKLQTA